MLTPIIKWPGGKYKEFDFISHMIPHYSRYIEPFFGGGGVFYRLQPEKAIINDVCKDLVLLYKFVKNKNTDFNQHLKLYVNGRNDINDLIYRLMPKFISIYDNINYHNINKEWIKEQISDIIHNHFEDIKNILGKELIIDYENLEKQIIKNLQSKIIRTKNLEQKKGKLPVGDLEKNVETGFRSGLYMHFRDLMNFHSEYNVSNEKKIANYYFIREFCYACMFRYNKKGHFNIPYGGIAYNDKNFSKKVEYLLSEKVSNVFSGTDIYCEDFEKILNNQVLNEDDFVFLDPPYDTEFDDYHGDVFSKSDQKRLAKSLLKLNAKFLMIIKKTDFIYDLYANKGLNIDTFDKKYLVNIKGRNNQDVEHLIIYNYEIGLQKQTSLYQHGSLLNKARMELQCQK